MVFRNCKSWKRAKLLNTQQYIQLRKEAISNAGREPDEINDWDLLLWDNNRYTDWQKELIGGTSPTSNLNISISGGNSTTSFRLGGSIYKQGSVLPIEMNYNKMTTSLSLNHKSDNKKLTINLSTNYGADKTNSTVTYSIIPLAFELPPNAPPLFNNDGSLHWEQWSYSNWDNPISGKYNPFETKVQNLITNLEVSLELYKGLELKTNLGYTQNIKENKNKRFKESISPDLRENSQHSAGQSYNKRLSWLIEPQLTYHCSLGKGTYDALVGVTFQQNESVGFSVSAQGYVTKTLVGYMPAANSITSGPNQNIIYRYNAIFGRIGYNWERKYYINFTGRRDGSSRFGPSKRFANFWAIGSAWVFSEEDVIKKKLPILSFGKFRTSYGVTGSDQIGDYGYMDVYESTGAPGGLYPTKLFNTDFAWEENKKFETAIQLGFFKDYINFDIGWYKNRSSNQLVGYPLASTTGFNIVQANLPATVQNSGWEILLALNQIKNKNFKWNTTLNVTLPKNKLVNFPKIEQTPYNQLYRIGYPLKIRFLHQYDGIDPETGYHKVVDVNGDGSFNHEDRIIIKDLDRKIYGGISNNLTMKGWKLNFLWDFAKQNGNYWGRGFPGRDKTNRPYEEYLDWKNGSLYIEDSPQASTGYNLSKISELGVVNASFLRLKTLSLSYTLSNKLLKNTGLVSCNIFISTQNLVTITPYKGINVENPYFPGTIPSLKTYTSGIQISF